MPEHLRECLAYHVLLDPGSWLGFPSPEGLNQFLNGAEWRATFAGTSLRTWRLWGPLSDRAFDASIVAETGHPDLSLRWPSALEFLHFCALDALADLRRRMESFSASAAALAEVADLRTSVDSPEAFLLMFAKRPGMVIGSNTGLALQNFLHGATRGADWLELPDVPAFRRARQEIEERSEESYGTSFAAYRAYRERGATELLQWADIEEWAGVDASGAG